MKRRLFWIMAWVAALPMPAMAIDFGVHGYYRNRYEFSNDLDTQKTGTAFDNNRLGIIQFSQMRLRTEPVVKLNDNLSLHAQFDFLDNLLFGSSNTEQLEILSPIVGTQTLPAGPGSLGVVGGAAGENGSVNVRRVWADILVPFGKFRLGRQPSHWGLGIFQNDGAGFQGDFGDSSDRVMFITQVPLKETSALNAGLVWDTAFESQFDPSIQGLGGQIRDNGQDSQQYALFLLYEEADWELGTFSGIRRRDGSAGTTMTANDALCVDEATTPANCGIASGIDGNTLMYFFDLYGRWTKDAYHFGLEGVYLGGKVTTGLAIDAIPFSVFDETGEGIIQLPAKQDMQTYMLAAEAGAYYPWGGEWEFKTGIASGDKDPLSTKITQFGFRPDYDIALLMFDVPLGTSPTIVDNNGVALSGGVPITGNFINNALYVAATYKYHFEPEDVPQANDFSVGGRIATAWAPAKNINLDFGSVLGRTDLPAISETADSFFQRWYGFETDLIVDGRFYDYLRTALEIGVLFPSRAYDIEVNLTDPSGIVGTIPADKASFALGARFTVAVEF